MPSGMVPPSAYFGTYFGIGMVPSGRGSNLRVRRSPYGSLVCVIDNPSSVIEAFRVGSKPYAGKRLNF